LCQQIHTEAKRFGKCYNLRSVACYGGGSKWEQTKALQQGAEIVVATPGRLVDLVRTKAASLLRVTYLVFDEADRMFEIGFEPQVRSIANNVRPDRQCLLFSATCTKTTLRPCSQESLLQENSGSSLEEGVPQGVHSPRSTRFRSRRRTRRQ